jgi:peptidyl-tRNA hydrolase
VADYVLSDFSSIESSKLDMLINHCAKACAELQKVSLNDVKSFYSLKSIDAAVGKEYIRVRVGVDNPQYKSQVADYVLSDFSSIESSKLDMLITHCAKACEELQNVSLNDVKSFYSLKSIDALEQKR